MVAPSPPALVDPAPAPLPPCATSPRDATQVPAHVIELVGVMDAMTVVDLGSGDGYFLCPLSRASARAGA